VQLPLLFRKPQPSCFAASHIIEVGMIIDLSGRRAVVTGSTSGIGFAIVRGLAGAGASVVINGRSPGTVKAARQRLEKEIPGCSVEGIAADLASAEGVTEFVRLAGEADILVNNLGIFEPSPFEAITDAGWQRYFDTNVMSGVRLSRHYLPAMLARGWGAGRFHLQRVGAEHSGRDDPLRDD